MIMLRILATAGLCLATWLSCKAESHWQETPFLQARVTGGELPPVAERIPEHPRVIDLKALGREPGRPGGTIRTLIGDQRDIRYATVYGYARLVVFNAKLEIVPDILESYDVVDDKIFTFHLRPGHKWSDGHPFTAEDFRYFWEDVANNERLSPGGPPAALLSNGQKPRFEVLDPLTIRYSWDQPNPGFLEALASPQPLYLYMPAHYLKQFHPRYTDPAKLKTLAKEMQVKDWGAIHERKSRQYRPENPDLPTLDPWRNTVAPPAEVFVFERNPFFHRVDENGYQLPYVDEIRMSVVSNNLIPAKVGSGEADLQARYLHFDNYTFLKEAAQRNNLDIRLWRRAEGSYVALMPNLNVADPVWRVILRDVRFRRALSLGIDRHDINQVIFFGLAREGANTVLPESPLYRPEYASAYASLDIATANRLLDEMGLTKRDFDDTRLLPDGRRAEIIVEAAGENSEEIDVLELVRDDLLKLGIKIFTRTSLRDALRRRVSAGQVVMSVGAGFDNALATEAMEPSGLAPSLLNQYQWPLWGQYFETNGREGEPPALPEVKELAALHERWRISTSAEERTEIWHRMLQIHAEQVFVIGIVNSALQPIVASKRLRNLPREALYSFEPGAFLGIYMPDTFWFSEITAAR